MACKCASVTDEWHGWECSVTGGACMYLTPDSKQCAKDYGEGPDAKKYTTIEDLDLTVRTYNCLKRHEVETIEQLKNMTIGELLEVRNLGKKSASEVICTLKELFG